VLVALPASVGAQTAREEANALFRRASALYSRGDHAGALELLQQAQQLYPSHKIEVSIGYSLEKLGRLPEAAGCYERFLRSGADPALARTVKAKLRAIRESLGMIAIGCATPNAVVVVDGQEVGRTPLAHDVYVFPGPHQVTIRHRGETLLDVTLSLERGERTLAMAREPRASRALAVAASPPVYKRWWFWTAIGGAVVTAVLVGAIAPNVGGSDRMPGQDLGLIDMTKP